MNDLRFREGDQTGEQNSAYGRLEPPPPAGGGVLPAALTLERRFGRLLVLPEVPQAKPRAQGNCSPTKARGIPQDTSASQRLRVAHADAKRVFTSNQAADRVRDRVRASIYRWCGPVAQLVRAPGSYPECPRFESWRAHSSESVPLGRLLRSARRRRLVCIVAFGSSQTAGTGVLSPCRSAAFFAPREEGGSSASSPSAPHRPRAHSS